MLRISGALAVLGGAALLACGLPAAAAPMTTTAQTASIPMTTTDWKPGSFSDGVNPLTFTKFNPALGTLEAVNLSLAYTFDQGVSMTFKNPATITVDVNPSTVDVNRPDGSALLNTTIPDYSVSQSESGPIFPNNVTLPEHTTKGSATPLALASKSDLALFTQSAPSDTLIKLPATATSHSSFTSSSGNGVGTASVTAGVVATLTYTYEPKPLVSADQTVGPRTVVPEPSTFAALGLGFGGYLLARRNRRSTSAR